MNVLSILFTAWKFIPFVKYLPSLGTGALAVGPILASIWQILGDLLAWVWEFLQTILAKPTRLAVLLLIVAATGIYGRYPVIAVKKQLAQCDAHKPVKKKRALRWN